MNWYKKFCRFAAFRYHVAVLAKKIATRLFETIVGNIKKKKLVPYQIIIDQSQEKDLSKYRVNKVIIEIDEWYDGINAIMIGGNFNEYWRNIMI